MNRINAVRSTIIFRVSGLKTLLSGVRGMELEAPDGTHYKFLPTSVRFLSIAFLLINPFSSFVFALVLAVSNNPSSS